MTTATVYTRYSPRPGAETCESIEVQLERCRAYCAGHGYAIGSEHADREMSGGRADNREALQAAIAATCKSKGVLVVAKLDRLARCTRDALEIVDRLHLAKADLASISEQLNTRSPAGKAFFTIMAVFAEFERATISERTSNAMRHFQAGGRRMTRADRCPYGQQLDPVDPSRMIDQPEEQAALERIRQLRAEGLGSKSITKQLDVDGIPSRGHRWHHSTVRAVLLRLESPIT